MSKLFPFIAAALFVAIASSNTNAVNTRITGEKNAEQSESVTNVKSTVSEKTINPVYYGWDMTDPSEPVYRRIDEPLDIDNKCDTGSNICVLESQTDLGETITDAQADNLTPAPGSSSTGQYLF